MRQILADYVTAGFILVPIPLGHKGPVSTGWNLRDNCIDDPEVALHMDGNVGLAHAYSGTCCIDFDNLTEATAWFKERGVDVNEHITAPNAVMISSGRENRAKLLFRIAKPLPSFNLGSFELRCATSKGTTVQDVLPPSIHPVTGLEYEWAYGDELFGHWSLIPELPKSIEKIWKSLITPETKIKPPKPAKPTASSLERIREQLFKHNPDEGYDEWVKAGMALHHETNGSDEGFDLWEEWSATGEKYKGTADLVTHWRSFKAETKNPVTIASLRVDEPAKPEDFPLITDEESPLVPSRTNEAKEALRKLGKEVMRDLPKDKSGKYLPLVSSVATMMDVASSYTGAKLSYDSFKDQIMYSSPGGGPTRPIKDTDYTQLRMWFERDANFYPVSREMTRDAVHYVAESNMVDTAQMWLLSLKWDGVPRIEKFMAMYFGTIEAEYERAVGVYLWTALAGRVMQPGCQVDMVPILVGSQGLGKSQGVRAIVPDPAFFTEIRLDESDDAIARKMRGTIIGELAELRGLRNGDRDRIKAFVTRMDEKWTPKYMEFATTFSRRLVMIGTTNDDEFLDDDQERRWLPVKTLGVDVAAIKRDRDQLWAEALQLWLQHGICWQGAEELAVVEHEEYKLEDPWIPPIEQFLREFGGETFHMNEVLAGAVGLDIRTVGRVHDQRAAKIMRRLGCTKISKREGNRVRKLWVKPKNALTTPDPTC